MHTHLDPNTSATPAGRCLSCGEHVPFGAGSLIGVGVTHRNDRGCASAVRYLDEPFNFGSRGPAWATAQIEPDGTPFGAPAGA